MAAMLHQAFLLGAIYELDMFGHVTRRLFENLNTRFYQSSSEHKFISLIYGEISEDARFRFLSAAQPFPIVFSRKHDRFMEVSADLCVSFPPLGMLPSLDVTDRQPTASPLGFKDHYQMNEWVIMGEGDIFLLHTDGWPSTVVRARTYFPGVSSGSSGRSRGNRPRRSSSASQPTCSRSGRRPTTSASSSSSEPRIVFGLDVGSAFRRTA